MAIHFDFLPVKGEAILISETDECFTMLIDGGSSHPFDIKRSNFKKSEYYKENNKKPLVDLCIITHIDQDHIKGMINLLNDGYILKNIKQVWFNEPKTAAIFTNKKSNKRSVKQGVMLGKVIENNDIEHVFNISTSKEHNRNFQKKVSSLSNTLNFELLSPNEEGLYNLYHFWDYKEYEESLLKKSKKQSSEIVSSNNIDCESSLKEIENKNSKDYDKSIPNQSSIAFILRYKEFVFLLLADAHIDVICDSLIKNGYSEEKPLYVDFVKLSHHGGKKNINIDFFKLVRTNKYVICRNEMSKLPNFETIFYICCCRENKDEAITIYINKKYNNHINSINKENLKENNVCIKEKTRLTFGDLK